MCISASSAYFWCICRGSYTFYSYNRCIGGRCLNTHRSLRVSRPRVYCLFIMRPALLHRTSAEGLNDTSRNIAPRAVVLHRAYIPTVDRLRCAANVLVIDQYSAENMPSQTRPCRVNQSPKFIDSCMPARFRNVDAYTGKQNSSPSGRSLKMFNAHALDRSGRLTRRAVYFQNRNASEPADIKLLTNAVERCLSAKLHL